MPDSSCASSSDLGAGLARVAPAVAPAVLATSRTTTFSLIDSQTESDGDASSELEFPPAPLTPVTPPQRHDLPLKFLAVLVFGFVGLVLGGACAFVGQLATGTGAQQNNLQRV